MRLMRYKALEQVPQLDSLMSIIYATIGIISRIYRDVLYRNNNDCIYKDCFTTAEWEKLMFYKGYRLSDGVRGE